MAKKIHIPEPCHENWSAMSPVSHDCRHCSVCEKSVVDFSLKTDAEILEILRQSTGKVCGKFRQDQLERPLLSTRPALQSNKSNISWRIAASVAAMLSVQQAAAQQPAIPISTDTLSYSPRDKMGGIVYYYDFLEFDTVRIISGKIIHPKSQQPIAGCRVLVSNSFLTTRAVTDENGIFNLEYPANEINEDGLTLTMVLTGYEPQELKLPEKVKTEDLAIKPIRYKLKKREKILMGCPAFIP